MYNHTDEKSHKRKHRSQNDLIWCLILGLTFVMALAALILGSVGYKQAKDIQCSILCVNGSDGIDGINGTNGTDGTNGVDGSVLDYADFYALMPGDNSATIALGADVKFPTDGPAKVATGITSISTTQFNIALPGIYEVSFFVSVSEAGQLVITLNGTPVASTVTGRATGTNYIMANLLITVSTVNTLLTVRNPAGNPGALTITTIAGGASAVSAHLKIIRLS
jgi:hypothetical protein